MILSMRDEIDERYRALAAGSHLPPAAAGQLLEIGFVVIHGPTAADDMPRLQDAYDRAVSTADAADVHISSSTRVAGRRAKCRAGREIKGYKYAKASDEVSSAALSQ